MSRQIKTLYQQVVKALPNINVEPDDYCVGYWAREAGMPSPTVPRGRDGWNTRNAELADES